MMNLLFDEDLVEAVTFLCASGKRKDIPSLQVRRFHAERERLYAILDPDQRHAAFFRLHLSWFREWGRATFLADAVSRFSILAVQLDVMAFRKARQQSEEGAELYVNSEDGHHGIIALRPERFANDAALECFLNHELLHLSDMVDPSFDYSPDVFQPGQTASQQRLMRERYRLLWDVTIDGRLIRAGRQTIAGLEQRRNEFDQAYRFLPGDRRIRTFGMLWSARSPRHSDLVSLASDPRHLDEGQVAGAPCPLCGFATFEWANLQTLKPETLARIQKQFPRWTGRKGACERCVEIYQSTAELDVPATVCL
jgi:hypothetical protein